MRTDCERTETSHPAPRRSLPTWEVHHPRARLQARPHVDGRLRPRRTAALAVRGLRMEGVAAGRRPSMPGVRGRRHGSPGASAALDERLPRPGERRGLPRPPPLRGRPWRDGDAVRRHRRRVPAAMARGAAQPAGAGDVGELPPAARAVLRAVTRRHRPPGVARAASERALRRSQGRASSNGNQGRRPCVQRETR